MLGNSETGKSWIDFVKSNFTIGGMRTRRDVEDKLDNEAIEQGKPKRQKMDLTSDYSSFGGGGGGKAPTFI